MPTFFGLLFVTFLLHYFVRILRETEASVHSDLIGFGLFFCLWLVLVAKFSDIGALLVGKTIGRTKMAPSISPGKTVEGLIGGLGASAGIGALLPWLVNNQLSHLFDFGLWSLEPAQGAWWGLVIGIVSVIGDLIASVLKRLAGMKDSGGAIPGIGGLLDLTDSLILSAPTGYFIILLIHP